MPAPVLSGVVAALLLPVAHGLVAYNCNSTKSEIATVSLVDSPTCENQTSKTREELTKLQIVQRVRQKMIPYKTCLIEVSQDITHCGMHSHSSSASEGLSNFLISLEKGPCETIHQTGVYHEPPGPIVSQIKRHGETRISVNHAGAVSGSNCQGVAFQNALSGRGYSAVIVRRSYTFRLTAGDGLYSLAKSTIMLTDGTRVMLDQNTGGGFHPNHGQVYGEVEGHDSCTDGAYETLYSGKAMIVTPSLHLTETEASLVTSMVIVESEGPSGLSFALQLGEPFRDCHIQHYRTEHPDITVVRSQDGLFLFSEQRTASPDVDLVALIDSKFSFLEKRVRTNMRELRDYLLSRVCALEQEQVQDLLASAYNDPEEFAYRFNGNQPGATAIVNGEVAHVFKCEAVPVKRRDTPGECYSALPVETDAGPRFMTPRSRVLIKQAAKVACNGLTPALYKVGEQWFGDGNSGAHVIAPQTLRPRKMGTQTWEYKEIGSFAQVGIYTAEAVKAFQDNLVFPEQTAALTQGVAVSLANPRIEQGGTGLLDSWGTSSLLSLRNRLFWAGVGDILTAGSAVGVVVGLYFFLKWSLALIDMFVNCRTLHMTRGWGRHMLLGAFPALTHLYTLLRWVQPDAQVQEIDIEGAAPPGHPHLESGCAALTDTGAASAPGAAKPAVSTAPRCWNEYETLERRASTAHEAALREGLLNWVGERQAEELASVHGGGTELGDPVRYPNLGP